MKTFYLTDSGKVRDHNEDSVTILKNKSNEYLLIVADGMGGHRAGEVASSIVIKNLSDRFNESFFKLNKAEAVEWIKDATNEINSKIDFKEFIFIGKVRINTFNNISKKRISVFRCEEINQKSESEKLIKFFSTIFI